MSNRDGRKAKKSKKHAFSNPGRKCPICGSSLDKCNKGYLPSHSHHRMCKTCGYSNY